MSPVSNTEALVRARFTPPWARVFAELVGRAGLSQRARDAARDQVQGRASVSRHRRDRRRLDTFFGRV